MSSSIQGATFNNSGQSEVFGSSSGGNSFDIGSSLNLPKDAGLDDIKDLAEISYGGTVSKGEVSDKVNDAVTAVLRDVGSQLSPDQVNKLRDLLMPAANSAFPS